MKLFIIGNGFDLAHGLPTKYWDFRKYLEKVDPEFIASFEGHYDIYPNIPENEKINLFWNNFEANLANIDEDNIISNAVSIEMGLESGDIGIMDTLYMYFGDEYGYIKLLAQYLKKWIETININEIKPKTKFIQKDYNALYITFNYTTVLENIYKINEKEIIHIHGSVREQDDEPILGHGNEVRINKIRKELAESEKIFDEKMMSICKVLSDYYAETHKNVKKYMYKLNYLINKDIDEIIVIGHSISGVDMPYFKFIEAITQSSAKWSVYYHDFKEKERIIASLKSVGVDDSRITMMKSIDFFNV